MTAITINQSPILEENNKSETINHIIEHVLESIKETENVVTNVQIDGENFDFYSDEEVFEQSAVSFKMIDFTIKTSLELAFEALASSNDYIDLANDKIQELVLHLRENNSQEANIVFTEVIEVLDLFVQLISGVHKTIGRQRPNTKIQVVHDLQIHLLSIVKALVPAKEKNDIIMLSDLLEYELVDNLTQWKIKAIPELKKLQNV